MTSPHVKFEIARHTDPTYAPPAPWNAWDDYAGCWTCASCGSAAGFQLHNPACRSASSEVVCACYGCTIQRQRAGMAQPDRSGEPCSPPDACNKDDQCWTHSEWIDEAACDPPGACATRHECVVHGRTVS